MHCVRVVCAKRVGCLVPLPSSEASFSVPALSRNRYYSPSSFSLLQTPHMLLGPPSNNIQNVATILVFIMHITLQ